LTPLKQAMLRDDAVRSELERFDLLDERGKFRIASLEPLLKMSPVISDFILANLQRIARMDRLPVSCEESDPPVGRYIEFETPERTYLVTRIVGGRRWQLIPLARNYRTSDDYKPRFGRTVIRGDLWKGFHSDMAHVGNEGKVKFNNGKKPVRLIKQLVRWANNKPDALVLDFFGGSGTTAHAVMEMNAEDDGHRRAVVVTNNEINEKTRNTLRKMGLRQGDAAWEAEGVYEAVAKPRLRNVAMAERTAANVEFFDLTYLNPALIELDLAFEEIAPLLWMRAGSKGRCIAQRCDTYELADTYAVLFDIDSSREFITAVGKARDIGAAFVITDDETQYQAVVGQLPEGVESVQLYEAYLQTFRRNPGGV
jgi:adenine-specific DNA-methyltransferase